ncbi:ABC transporter permease [Dyella sp. 333MFSha]|uniref:ABC transporter permease n=1 Tax=Dyella sp. 333MFSha TaxID=1798240 RepID=UPI00088DF06B|nr:ABC transporter permease [Dyella sp. 333MFSha]SDG47441.1 lipopolysaccharide transport system permease protein [Dyella sp. 333MFSha]
MSMVDGRGPFRDFLGNRLLVKRLAARDIRGRYQGSIFGALWSFATPLLLLSAYWFLLGVVLQARFGTAPQIAYPVILFSGLIVHLFCAEVIGRSAGLIFEHATYVKKVVFPLTVLPWMSMATAVFHLVVNLSILFIGQLLIVGHIPPTWPLVFVVLLPLVPLLLGLSWLLSALCVYLRDIQQVIPLVLTMMMFLSPIFFPMEMVPASLRGYMYLNPTTAIILQVRAVTILGQAPDLTILCIYCTISLAVMGAGYWFFARTRRGFADVL